MKYYFIFKYIYCQDFCQNDQQQKFF